MPFTLVSKRWAHVDWLLVGLVSTLSVVGLVILHSAGFNAELGYSPPMRRQLMSLGVGVVAFVACALCNANFWRRWSYLLYFIGCALLLAILFKGSVAGGARRWLEVGGLRMQPSEVMKVGMILALARLFSSEKAPRDGYTLWTMFFPFLLLAIPVVLILAEPDLGTALCHILIGGSMLLLAGVRLKTIFRLALVGAVLAPVAWTFMLKDYQKQRVLTFLSPESDPLGSGYHAIQSKIAVGSGSMTGKGFLQGTQTQLSFLPEQTTDFIFSVLAEEWGFLGTLTILILYGLLILRLINIAAATSEPFPAFVAFGVAAMLFWHVIINIGMVVGILPVVGLTLALLSFGGSSLVAVLASLGIVVGFTARRYMFT